MARQIAKGDNLGAALANLFPRELAYKVLADGPTQHDFPTVLTARNVGSHNFAVDVKAQDLHAHRAGPASLNFVLVTKQVDASLASAVVEVTLYEYAE